MCQASARAKDGLDIEFVQFGLLSLWSPELSAIAGSCTATSTVAYENFVRLE
jgi:hypothetical protein